MDTPERGILRNGGKNEHGDEEANLGAMKEQDGVQSVDSSGRDGKACNCCIQPTKPQVTPQELAI